MNSPVVLAGRLPQSTGNAPVDITAAWHVAGNGINMPDCFEDHTLSGINDRSATQGYWFMAAGLKATEEFALMHLAQLICGTTSGVTGRHSTYQRDLRTVQIMSSAFCEAFNLAAVSKGRLPERVKRLPNVLVFEQVSPGA